MAIPSDAGGNSPPTGPTDENRLLPVAELFDEDDNPNQHDDANQLDIIMRAMNNRFDAINNRFDDAKLDTTNRFDDIIAKLDVALNNRFDDIIAKLDVAIDDAIIGKIDAV